ncbi:MAG TPA: helix-turn-helix domain-containing protein [Blastocatellia bacterium]
MPKRLARVLRFQNALAMSRQQMTLQWARIAANCGYFDQSHMARDFREFGGDSPASLELAPASLTAVAVAAQPDEKEAQ